MEQVSASRSLTLDSDVDAFCEHVGLKSNVSGSVSGSNGDDIEGYVGVGG